MTDPTRDELFNCPTRELDPGFKAEWIQALRSGDYEQTHYGALRNEGGFCCLGVACDLVDNSKWHMGSEPGSKANLYDGGISYPPAWVGEKISLDFEAQRFLAELNDTGWSFKEIADWIERNL